MIIERKSSVYLCWIAPDEFHTWDDFIGAHVLCWTPLFYGVSSAPRMVPDKQQMADLSITLGLVGQGKRKFCIIFPQDFIFKSTFSS